MSWFNLVCTSCSGVSAFVFDMALSARIWCCFAVIIVLICCSLVCVVMYCLAVLCVRLLNLFVVLICYGLMGVLIGSGYAQLLCWIVLSIAFDLVLVV